MTKTKITFLSVILLLFLFQGCSSPLRGYVSTLRVSVNDNYSQLFSDPAYSRKVSVSGIKVFTQQVSCGYAVLQMLSEWQNQDLTEEKLFKMNNNKVTTSVGNGFEKEISKQFPDWNVTRYVNCSNNDLLKMVYKSLDEGFPVPFEWAAKDTNGNWTLHFSLVTEMDFVNNAVTIANPYGYMETLTVQDFIKATRYESYENMEWYFEAGFNVELFNQNTIYVIKEK